MEKKKIRVSVRELVESVLLRGDLNFGASDAIALWDGSAAHREYQKEQGENYLSEVQINGEFEGEYTHLTLQGRIDGMRCSQDGWILEEIKSSHADFATVGDGRAEHWAQALIYAALICREKQLESINVRLIYIQLPSGKRLILERTETCEGLETLLQSYLSMYLHRQDVLALHERNRNRLLEEMEFCFPAFRQGQRTMAAEAYRTVRDCGRILMEAPTGIGKTAAVLFGTLKAMPRGNTEKIFYLCSRTTIKQIAEETLNRFFGTDSPFRRVTLTAKQKCCPMNLQICDTQNCPYAKGYFDRLPEAMQEAEPLYQLDSDAVMTLAERYSLCPFELSLNLAETADLVICDYNYAFDPRVRIQRFFADGGAYALLVDEAHQLPDRARDMFSAEISRKDVRNLRQQIPKGKLKGFLQGLRSCVNALYKGFHQLEETLGEEGCIVDTQVPEAFTQACKDYCDFAGPALDVMFGPWNAAMTELYFVSRNFVSAQKGMDKRFRFLVQKNGKEMRAVVLCLDPSEKLKGVYRKTKSQLFFSATLSPQTYYQSLMGIEDATFRRFPSPFDPFYQKVLVRTDLSTSYRDREGSYAAVARAIHEFISVRKGHYLVFFPSYQYMKSVEAFFREFDADVPLLVQDAEMDEESRQNYLDCFGRNTRETLVGFAVMGGYFAEGIDLSGDSLIGVVIVGVGLPQISTQRNLIRDYHADAGEDGFKFAYQYPGFNRVMQAAGRLIRTEHDRGILLLIDPRFVRGDYRRLMPNSWFSLIASDNDNAMRKQVEEFWNYT